MKRMLSRIPNVVLLLLLLLGITLGSGCGGSSSLTIAFTTSPQILDAGRASHFMTIQIQDSKGNPYSPKTETVISLISTSSKGRFDTSATGTFSGDITSVTISKGTAVASFYYMDTTAGSPTITVAESPSQGWTAATQVETVKSAALDHFSFATISNQTENSTFSVSITALDVYGNTITSYTDTNTLSDTTGTISPITTGAFTGGIWTGNITVASVQSGVTITTSGGAKSGVSNAFDIVTGIVGAITKLAFTTIPQTIDAGNISGIITLQTQDTSSNQFNVTADTTINLTSNSTNGTFYSDAEGLNSITQVTIKAGESSASFYYKDTTAGSPTITGAESPSQGWTAATQVETINTAALDHFSFAAISNQTENVAFSVSITAQDVYGNIVTSYTDTNTLSDTTGTISPITTGAFTGGIWTGNITVASVRSGNTITTSGRGKSGVSNTFNIVSGAAGASAKLAFITVPQTIDAGNVSGIITLQTQDTSNKPYNVTANTVINLTSNSTNGTFYSDAEGLNPITLVTIKAGEGSASFYYKDTTAGSPTITGAESPSQGWMAATQVEVVNAGALDHFSFATISNQTEKVAFSVSVTAQDVYGNTVTSYTDTNTLSDTTGSISPITTGAFTGGIWTGNITVTSVQSGFTITTSGGGKSGVSNVFDIVAGAITKLAFTTTPQTIDAGNVSGIITLQTQDTSSNPYNVTADMVINLTSNSANGTFYSDAEGLNPTTLVTIKAGKSSASFYYKDTAAGSPTITVAESPSQGWTAATQLETINPATPDDTASKTGFPLFMVIIIGAGGIILGLIVGYLVFFRIKHSTNQKIKEIELKPQSISTAAETKIEIVDTTKQEQVLEVTQSTAEIPDATRQEQVPEVTQSTARIADATRQEQVSDLLLEIETNRRIATTSVKDSLVAFQTQIWDFKHDEVNSLSATVKEELTKAYTAIYQANSIVWLTNQLGRRSSNLDDNYAKLCASIADQLDRVRQLIGQS